MTKFSGILMFLFLVITSCSSDDTETKVSENIVGTWIGTDLRLSGEIETEVEGQVSTTILSGEGYDLTNALIFGESPNFMESQGKVNMKVSFTVNDIIHTEDIEDFELLGDGTWEINGGELIIANPDEAIDEDELRTMNISKLTKNELIINITETVEEIEDGETTTGVIVIFASYMRQ